MPIQAATGTGQGRDGRHRDVVSENQGCGPGGTTTSIENDVVHAHLQGEINVRVNMLGRHLHADGDAAR